MGSNRDHYGNLAVARHGEVPPGILRHWRQTVGKQLICQVELLAFALVRDFYGDALHNRACIAFLDNEAARRSLINGSSPSNSVFATIDFLALRDAQQHFGIWYEGVCTHTNIADLPSKGQPKQAAAIVNGRVLSLSPGLESAKNPRSEARPVPQSAQLRRGKQSSGLI